MSVSRSQIFVCFTGKTPSETWKKDDGFPINNCKGLLVVGLAVCWGGKDAYYISLQQKPQDQLGKKSMDPSRQPAIQPRVPPKAVHNVT